MHKTWSEKHPVISGSLVFMFVVLLIIVGILALVAVIAVIDSYTNEIQEMMK